jgi:hypothetical protein
MNQVAINKELSNLQSQLAATNDKYDIAYLTGRINSLKAELAGVVKQDYTKVIEG